MAKTITKGKGTTFGYAEVGGSTYTPLTQITAMTPPKIAVDEIATECIDDDSDWKTTEAGWFDGGETELTVQHQPTQQTTIIGLIGLTKSFQIKYKSNATLTFDGFIKGVGDEVDKDNLVSCTVTIRVSGKPVFVGSGS